MTQRSTRTSAWIRQVCRTAATLLTAAVLATPGPAQAARLFDVSVSPTAAVPGQDLTVSVSPLVEGLVITSCRAELSGETASECVGSNGRWAAHLAVPRHTKPGAATVAWSLGYRLGTGRNATTQRAQGTRAVTVLPATPPDFSVALDPASASPGETVSVTFTALDPKTTITTCSAQLGDVTAFDCAGSGAGWSLALSVPPRPAPSDTVVAWSLVYERGGYQTEARGTTPFTVLPSVVVSRTRSDASARTATPPGRSRHAGDAPSSGVPRPVHAPPPTAPPPIEAPRTELTDWVWDQSDLGVLLLGVVLLIGTSLHFRRGGQHPRASAHSRQGSPERRRPGRLDIHRLPM